MSRLRLTKDCDRVGQWLDEGTPKPAEVRIRRHMEGCDTRAQALRAAAVTSPEQRITAPAGFADRVMAWLSVPVPATPREAWSSWWTHVIADPVAAVPWRHRSAARFSGSPRS